MKDAIYQRLADKVQENGSIRIKSLFNMISSKNSKLVEQVAILLANISSSGDLSFQFEFMSDLCINTIVKIVLAPS